MCSIVIKLIKIFYKINPTNCIIRDEVELADGSKKHSFLLEKRDNLKLGGKITKIEEFDSYINKNYVLINNEYKFTYSTNVVKCGHLSQYTPVRFLKVGDKILRDNMEEFEIKQIEFVKGVVKGKMIRTAENIMSVNGFFVKAQSSNSISGLDNLIFSPKVGQEVMSWSEEEEKIVSGIMDKVEDEKMPSRVVEITFNTGGHIWTAEFLFEKPLKIIYSASSEGKKVRVPKEKFFGWASYRPDLTMEIKHQEAMQLMPGMQCITPKRPDMEVTETLYGDMVASVVVSMREVVGKRSHWDIYEMKPMDTPNPNYFMNRLHVHNGPSNWPIPPAFGSEADIYGHWDVSHPSSFSPPSNTIYDLTSRGDVDANIRPGSSNYAAGAVSVTPATTNAMKYIPTPNKGYNFMKQPGNPYHVGSYGFFGPSSFSMIMTWKSEGGHPSYARITSVRPGYDFDTVYRGNPAPVKGQLWIYRNAWTQVTPPAIDYVPRPSYTYIGPKGPEPQPSWIISGVRYNAPSNPGRFRFHNFRNPGGTAFYHQQYEQSPSIPRTGSNRWGIFGNPGPDTASGECINGALAEVVFFGKAQPDANFNEVCEGIMSYYNTSPPGAQSALFAPGDLS